MLWRVLGASVDFIHALAMASWVLGLPLLFWRKWPRLTRAYALYSIAFVVVLQVSHALLGECVLTTAARALWQRAPTEGASASTEWFTVRLAEAVFHLTPSHQSIKLVSEALIVVTALGILISLRRSKHDGPAPTPPRPRIVSAGGPELRALRKPTKPASSALCPPSQASFGASRWCRGPPYMPASAGAERCAVASLGNRRAARSIG